MSGDGNAHVPDRARPDGLDRLRRRTLPSAVLALETRDADGQDGLVGLDEKLLADRQRLLGRWLGRGRHRLSPLRDNHPPLYGPPFGQGRPVDVPTLGTPDRRCPVWM